MEADELKAIVDEAIQRNEGAKKGAIMSELMSRDWAAEGKLVNKGALAQALGDALKDRAQ